jgi:transcriptional regulator with XRE-family HTH domain
LRRLELAERVIELRERAGLTQGVAAKRAGVGVTTWSNIETGTITRPHARTLIKIARAFGVEVEDLFEGVVFPKAPELTLEDVGAFLEREVDSRYIALPSAEWSVIEESATHEQRQAIDREWALIKQEWFASHGKTEAAPRLVPTGGNWGDVYSELFGRRLGIRLGIPASTAQAVVREAEEDALLIRTTGG